MPRRHLTGRFGALVIAALAAFFVTLSGQALAQGFDWSQLLGGGGAGGAGGGGGQKRQHSGQSNGSGVSVERSAPPFTGKFVGKQEDQGIENTMTAQFACFPANDADIPQTKAFVCYSGGSNSGGADGSGGPPPYGPPNGGPPSYGPPPGGGPPYGSPNGGPPNGPPPDVE
ncbi:MAG TPA: hypothetical protein VN867_03755 [Candidatus Binataceae bacterium]|nr:hypothetical protein [Candidatus Binataceae bacterium]